MSTEYSAANRSERDMVKRHGPILEQIGIYPWLKPNMVTTDIFHLNSKSDISLDPIV